MRIAIVGAGISGLVCAHVLGHDHEITVFEAAGYLGGHTNTIDVEIDGERHAVDTGFIVFNEHYYPKFVKLLARIGVPSKPTRMGFSLRCDATGLEYSGESLSGLFAQPFNLLRPSYLRMLSDILRFQKEGTIDLITMNDHTTVEEYVKQKGFSQQFSERFLVPLGSALWSSPLGQFRKFPVKFLIEFLSNHGMMQTRDRPDWRVIEGGSSQYVRALDRSLRGEFRLECPVESVARDPSGVTITARGRQTRFDQVILACHADQALAIVTDASATEREILGHFPYEANEAVLHTDESVLPRSRRAWASWNYHLSAAAEKRAAVTYNMNILQGIESRHVFCVSLNEPGINPERVIRRLVYHHPVFRPGRSRAQKRHAELIQYNRTSYCGAYWGFGFHEDGVSSAVRVCESFGCQLSI